MLCVALKSADMFLKLSNFQSSCAFTVQSRESQLKIKLSGISSNDPEIQLKARAVFIKMADDKCNSTRTWEGV